MQNDEFAFLYKKQTKFVLKLFSVLKNKIKCYNYYFDYSLSFHSDFFKLGKNTYLEGYFQSEKYFLNHRKQLVLDFCIDPNQLDNGFVEKIKNSESVGIHFRQGDYSDKKVANERHGICSIDYYKKSIELIQKKMKTTLSFFVFSDNISFAKEQLKKISADFTFIENAGPEGYIKDFSMMKICKHQIIANSTFSWWAAWLNENSDKIVIAPQRWLNDIRIETMDVIPESWIKI